MDLGLHQVYIARMALIYHRVPGDKDMRLITASGAWRYQYAVWSCLEKSHERGMPIWHFIQSTRRY